jgi:hypothetical protein
VQSYPLDLATILYVLQGQSGHLQASLNGLPGIGEPCQVRMVLTNGKVTTCTLETRRGALVAQGQRVLDLLAGLGAMDWLWAPGAGTPAQTPRRTTSILSPIPRKREPLNQQALWACSRTQRRVLGLIDGRRSLQEIAALLAVPPTDLERFRAVCYELQDLGLISLEQ